MVVQAQLERWHGCRRPDRFNVGHDKEAEHYGVMGSNSQLCNRVVTKSHLYLKRSIPGASKEQKASQEAFSVIWMRGSGGWSVNVTMGWRKGVDLGHILEIEEDILIDCEG